MTRTITDILTATPSTGVDGFTLGLILLMVACIAAGIRHAEQKRRGR